MADLTRDEVYEIYVRLRQTWATRNGEYDTARFRYFGKHWDPDTNPEPVNRYSLTLNYLKPIIDKNVQLLVGRMPAIQVLPPGTDEGARRLAEQLEGIIYGTWERNHAPDVFKRVAWDSFVLRRGLVYVWWDPGTESVRFRDVPPEHFFPEYDGDELYRVAYIQRRNTDALKKQFASHAEDILSDAAMDYPQVIGSSIEKVGAEHQTTIIDLFESDGSFYRVMGNAFISMNLNLPFKKVPFIEFPCFPISGDTEPLNAIDQLIELNQYLDQLVSQQADIIAKYSNPTVVEKATGQSPEAIRIAMGAPGAVIPIRQNGELSLLNWQGTVPAIPEQLSFVMDAIFDLAGKPRSSFGQTVTNQSGVVTNLTLTPTLQSNEYHESIWGDRLSELNEWILALWEKNMKADVIQFKGRKSLASGATRYFDVNMVGRDIGGWYKNRIKWPSAIRTDDPVYVQNLLQQLTASVPGISLYTYLEEMGREDVEAEIDRIQQQLEDPRLHPDRLAGAVDAATSIAQSGLPPGMEGFAPDAGVQPPAGSTVPDTDLGGAAFSDSLEAGASPHRDAMVKSANPSKKK